MSESHARGRRVSNEPVPIWVPAIFVVFFPPLAVYLVDGCHAHLVLNIILTYVTFWIGGVIHAAYVVSRAYHGKKGGPGKTTPLKTEASRDGGVSDRVEGIE
ncbi:MAG: hypothetical protein M1814_004250 [Vezdaea aestivalis]|nr:MAG: hypothetical protein M1814_004250 [Vezdaea aestivalis]